MDLGVNIKFLCNTNSHKFVLLWTSGERVVKLHHDEKKVYIPLCDN